LQNVKNDFYNTASRVSQKEQKDQANMLFCIKKSTKSLLSLKN